MRILNLESLRSIPGKCEDLLSTNPDAGMPISTYSLGKLSKPLGKLTPEERRLVGGLVTPGGFTANLVSTLAELREYDLAYGQLPLNGEALIAWKVERLTKDNRDHLPTSTAAWRYDRFATAINPATGTPFVSFSNREWHRFGVAIYPTMEEQDFLRTFNLPSAKFEEKTGRPLPELWRIIVFGNAENEILVDKCIGVEKNLE